MNFGQIADRIPSGGAKSTLLGLLGVSEPLGEGIANGETGLLSSPMRESLHDNLKDIGTGLRFSARADMS
jgi:hypothetical protein